jgi:putative selenium metabolism hydrolase
MSTAAAVEADIDEDEVVALARQLACTPSVSGREREAIALVVDAMTAAGYDDVVVDDVGNAIGEVGHGDGPRVLIDGHIDSIPLHSEDRWTVDPFGGSVIDGRLYGLGICDQKGSIAAAVHGVAAAHRREPLGGRVAVVASVCEEEMEGQALAGVVSRFGPDVAITSEPNDTRLCVGQRGRAKLWVRVNGRACHAGHARVGLNAAEALAAMIDEARRVGHPAHDRLGQRDLTCIDIASWPYPSVSTVPGRAEARFDCRFLPGETAASIIAVLREAAARAWRAWPEQPALDIGLVDATFSTWTGATFTAPEFAAAWWNDDEVVVSRAQAAMVEAGLDPTPTHYSFCTNGSLTAGELGIATLGFGVGVESMAHQVDEHITITSLLAGARGYAALARHLTAERVRS